MAISYGKFKDLDSVTLENEKTRAVFLKHFGGRMVSLVNLGTGREYITVGTEENHMIAKYGESFTELSDVSGVDEIFPSCDPCEYPLFPWEGHKIPPHGELWTANWDFEQNGDELIMAVHGVRFPYTFIKKINLLDTGILHTEYRIVNHSPYDMHFIWLLHPLFSMDEDVKITLPEGTTKFISQYSTAAGMSKSQIFDWPIVEIDGKRRDMSRTAEMEELGAEKLYASGKFDKGYMAITYESSGEGLGLRFPADKIPYAGLWISNGRLRGRRHIALEPATGGRDQLGRSVNAGESSILPGSGEYTFYMDYELF